jgi:7-carboxy-7-deazaguanine synthase
VLGNRHRAMTELLVSELFGPTVQGEGMSAGQPVVFVRLGLCNLDCAWCDTPFTWDWTGKNGTVYDKDVELSHRTVDDIVAWVDTHNVDRVVISGGEPLVQGRRLGELVTALQQRNYIVEIETNGTLSPSRLNIDWEALMNVRFNVSPKLPGSSVDQNTAINLDVLREHRDLVWSTFKFVITDPDIDEPALVDLSATVPIPPSRIWLMPEGRSTDDICRRLPIIIDMALRHGHNVSTRIHVHAYGDRRGV